jgi:hypothetical protein
MKIMPYKLLKVVYIILAIIAVVMYTLSLIFNIKIMIDYIVFPVADIDEEKSAKIDELNLVPRSNVSKDKVLMKCQHYKEVFPEKVTRTVTTDEEGLEIISIEYPYETYSNEALATLLSSPEWNFKEDEVIEDSPIEE